MQFPTINTYLEGYVGPQFMNDGAVAQRERRGKTNETIVGFGHSQHHEQTSRGKVYWACTQAVATFGTALTATGVTFHLWNPPGSPVNLEILQGGITILTAGTGGHVVWAYNVPTTGAVVAGTALTAMNMNGVAGYGLAKSATTLPAAPVAIRALAGAITAAGTNNIVDYVDGAIVVPPGAVLSVQGITIVGTGLIWAAWSEVPLSA
jgi:hypothetical protein